MCLQCKWNSKAKIANEDIICYKFLEHMGDNQLVSPYFNFPVKIGETYNTSLTTKRDPLSMHFVHFLKKIHIYEGFHSFKNLIEVEHVAEDDAIFVQCIIPKGSLYYEGKFKGDGYASDKITYIKIINF